DLPSDSVDIDDGCDDAHLPPSARGNALSVENRLAGAGWGWGWRESGGWGGGVWSPGGVRGPAGGGAGWGLGRRAGGGGRRSLGGSVGVLVGLACWVWAIPAEMVASISIGLTGLEPEQAPSSRRMVNRMTILFIPSSRERICIERLTTIIPASGLGGCLRFG